MNASDFDSGSGDSFPPDDAVWREISASMKQFPVERAELRDRVVEEVRGLSAATSSPANAVSLRAEADNPVPARSVAGSHRLAATVASLTAMLVLSFGLSGLMDEPSRNIRVAGSELMASILRTADDDWQVVVVTVPEKSQARFRNRISSSAMKHGMDVRSVDAADEQDSERHPDVFISSADSAAEVLQLIERATASPSGAVNRAEVVDMDREQLLQRFQSSMQSPTASEKFFGRMLIVNRDSPVFSVEHVSSAAGEVDAMTHIRAVESAGALGRKPILVVLTTKDIGAIGPQGMITPGKPKLAFVL